MLKFVALSILLISSAARSCPLPEGIDESRLVPVIRGNESIDASFPKGPKTVPRYKLNSEISVVFAMDSDSAISYFLIPTEEAMCWQDLVQLRKYKPNIERFSKNPRAVELSPGLFMVLAGGNYESSYLLEAEFLARTARSTSRAVVVGIPTRDVLLFSALENETAVKALRERLNRTYSDSDKVISNKPMRLEPGRVVVLE